MSEFQSDIRDKKYDEDGDELDKHGFKVKKYPDGLGHVRASVENCEQLCGLDKNVMMELLKGEWSESTTLNSLGRESHKITIEYNIKQKS
tara:strand:+ start:410 stop:679 length:270 start_codon:yes stop_codon:yes gene_type:complete